MPESCNICGDPMLPALRITSPAACTLTLPLGVCTSTPVQRNWPLACASMLSLTTWAEVQSVKLGRLMQVGRKKALAVFQRQPLR